MSTIKQKVTEGFTLVEVLIIAPVVIIVISGFIALIITMVGDVLAIRDRNNMAFEIRNTLDRIEQDTRLSTQFLTTSNTLLAPQGSDNNFTGTAAFSNSNSLILGTLTTDKNPTDTTRQLVFYAKQPNECGALQSYNRPFIGKTIYYIKDNSLWRRTYLFPYNTSSPANDETLCSTPWQQNSCSPGYTASRCQTNDVQMMQNVDSFNVKYYTTPQSTADIGASNALSATSIEVTINGKKMIAGRDVTNSGTVRVAKINNLDADLAPPTTPSVTSQFSGANTVTFTWPTVPSATSYLISYNINGGGWVDSTNDSLTTNFSVNAYRNDTVTIRVTARNSTGTSPYDEEAATFPAWNTCSLQNSWVNYDTTPGGYSTAAYTKTTNEVVFLKGTIKNGTTAGNPILCVLPAGYRPSHPLIFTTDTNNTASRIDINTAGEVRLGQGNAAWVALDGIRFVTSSAPYTWTDTSFVNLWDNWGAPYSPLRTTLDSSGRVHMQGVVKGSNFGDGTPVTSSLPAAHQSPQYLHLPVSANNVFNETGIFTAAEAKGIGGTNNYYSLQAMYYPNYTGWNNLTPLLAGWTYSGTFYTVPQYIKSPDGIVSLKGLIRNGTATPGTVIATLPPGYRPKERLDFITASDGSFGRFDIFPNGQITTGAGIKSAWATLDNIHFPAEQ